MSNSQDLALTEEALMPQVISPQERADLLKQWLYPQDPFERHRVDAAAQTPDEDGKVLCWRRRRRCSNPNCVEEETNRPYRFKGIDREMWNCPLCGKDRHCRKEVTPPNRGCEKHGGATPHGWDLPQTKTGKRSKYIKVDSVRADFERMLASPQLLDITEHIAFLQTRINEVLSEYGGGASRALLRQMKQNRAAYKANARLDEPNVGLARQLDRDLDGLISKGSKAYQVMDDWGQSVDRLTRLISARDAHVINERMMITNDKVWSILAHVEETYALGLAMLLEIDKTRVLSLAEAQDIQFEGELLESELFQMKEGLRADQEAQKRKILSFTSRRFKELAGSGLF